MLTALLVMAVHGQDALVMGHVADDKGEHLHFVTVMLKGTTTGSLSDKTGHFFLKDIPVGKQTLVFSCVGYTTEEREVNLSHNQTVELNVTNRSSWIMWW